MEHQNHLKAVTVNRKLTQADLLIELHTQGPVAYIEEVAKVRRAVPELLGWTHKRVEVYWREFSRESGASCFHANERTIEGFRVWLGITSGTPCPFCRQHPHHKSCGHGAHETFDVVGHERRAKQAHLIKKDKIDRMNESSDRLARATAGVT